MRRNTLRVVLDTNVVVSTLIFRSHQTAPLMAAWQSKRITPVVSKATASELIAVLRYPKFELGAADSAELLAAYLPYCEVCTSPQSKHTLPICRDKHDQCYLELASAARCDWLVTGDKDLLALRGLTGFEIVSVREAVERLTA